MDIFFAFLVVGLACVVLILKFDSRQTKKVQRVLKENKAVPQLMLLKATEKKLENLKTALRYDDAPQNLADTAPMIILHTNNREATRLTRIQELKVLSARYNNGEITLSAYNKRIGELMDEVTTNGKAYYMAS